MVNLIDHLNDYLISKEISENKSEFKTFENNYPDLEIAQFENSAPAHAEGTISKLPFYFVCKNGKAELNVGNDPISVPYYSSETLVGNKYDDHMEVDEFFKILDTLIKKLEKAPFLYRFEGKKVIFENDKYVSTNEKEIYIEWGFSSEDALNNLSQPSERLTAKGVSVEDQKEIFFLKKINSAPIENDTRDFPKIEPKFS